MKMTSLFRNIVRRPESGSGTHSPTSALPSAPPYELYDVTAFASEINLGALDVISWTPAWMSRAERLLLFSLIFGLRPARYLEIGTFKGGSALIVDAAMTASNNPGRMVCVDPDLRIAEEHRAKLSSRVNLLSGYSPAILPEAQALAGGAFDFALIDGDHTYEGVMRDAEGVLPFVAKGGYMLFHDAFFVDIERALAEFAAGHRESILNIGPLTRECTVMQSEPDIPVRWGGLHLMQLR